MKGPVVSIMVYCPKCEWSASVPSRDALDALEVHDFNEHDREGR